VVMREPEEIDAQEHDEILARVAAIDVAKATGMVCSRIPDDRRPTTDDRPSAPPRCGKCRPPRMRSSSSVII
jgi:hypothetical protein